MTIILNIGSLYLRFAQTDVTGMQLQNFTAGVQQQGAGRIDAGRLATDLAVGRRSLDGVAMQAVSYNFV